jgi:hypothetical protein
MKMDYREMTIRKNLLNGYKNFVSKQNEFWDNETEFHGYAHIHEFIQNPSETAFGYFKDCYQNSDRYYENAFDDLKELVDIANHIEGISLI